MKKKSHELIQELEAEVKEAKRFIEGLNHLSDIDLQTRTNPKSWNLLECIDHLLYYGNHYVNEFEFQILKSKTTAVEYYKPRILGGRIAESMKPGSNGRLKFKMKTFPSTNSLGKDLNRDVIGKFLAQLTKLESVLESSKSVNLNKVRVRLFIPQLTMSLGDTLRFVIYHNARHVQQMRNILAMS